MKLTQPTTVEVITDAVAQETAPPPETVERRPNRWLALFSWRRAALVGSLVLLVGVASLLYVIVSQPAWSIERIAGTPQIDGFKVSQDGFLAIGDLLTTDANSRAKIQVAQIGQVEVEPNSRVRLLETKPTEHRLALERGRLQAKILAPPRLFFVNTPSAVAIDYGCAYSLEVDDNGASLLNVTSGWVSLGLNGYESMVPEGATCATRPGIGPGTPYFRSASENFRSALTRFDFEQGGADALDVVLRESREPDTLTLWHLLVRVEGFDRDRVFDKISAFMPPPQGVTRAGIMRLDERMLDLWRQELEFAWFDFEPTSPEKNANSNVKIKKGLLGGDAHMWWRRTVFFLRPSGQTLVIIGLLLAISCWLLFAWRYRRRHLRWY